MATRTYEISKGQQYDREGAFVMLDTKGHGSFAATSYSADGKFSHGELVMGADRAAIAEAVARVIASGQPETLTLGQAEPIIPFSPEQIRLLAELKSCTHWNRYEGCPRHGELCHDLS
jgi:hypothetical protein